MADFLGVDIRDLGSFGAGDFHKTAWVHLAGVLYKEGGNTQHCQYRLEVSKTARASTYHSFFPHYTHAVLQTWTGTGGEEELRSAST